MFDKIEKKVHDVRKQPEHIRIRWVWGSVAVVMIFIVFIWILSMRINFLNVNSNLETQNSLNDFQKHIGDIKNTLPPDDTVSIDELLKENEITQ